jgi:murein DD-endopeptidase MepM/ murein hydrolase activator NlpD/muramidase (phage lysozyme)
MRILSPIIRVTIGTDLYMSGDGLLRFASVSLGEDARSSNCRFELYDPGLKIGAKYFDMSFKAGGIEVPPDLLEDPNKNKGKEGTISLDGGSSSVADASQSPEIKAWLDTIAYCEGTDGPDGYNTIFTHAKFSGFSDHPRQLKCSGSLCSDAAGRYQFLSTTWDGLGLGNDFSPAKQDKGAVLLLQSRGALDLARQGEAQIAAVCEKISYEWASIPPFRYGGQGSKTLAQIQAKWRERYAIYKAIPATAPQQAAAQQPIVKDAAESKPVEVSQKGTEIIIEIGFNPAQMTAYHFIHTATHTEGRSLDSTVFEGQTVRWLMTRRTKNTAYKDLTLRALADKVAKFYGLELEMAGDGPKYQFLDQSGLSDYQLLLRECKSIGYSIQDKGKTLILKPWKPEFTGFVITADILRGPIRFTDRASKDMQPSSTASPAAPESSSADPKVEIDRITGKPVVQKTEDSTATGKAGGKAAVITGPATKALSGTPAPESAQPDGGGALGESITGLPSQQVGSIDIGDGKAEAAVIKDESRRVKGYESGATILTTPEVLSIVPGSIIGLSRLIVPEVFAREWRVGSIAHAYQGGEFSTTLDFYTPQKMKAESSGAGTISLGDSTQPPTGKILNPHADGGQRGTPYDPGGAIRGRPHHGIDTIGDYSIRAGFDGTVTYAVGGCQVGQSSCGGGYGNGVAIEGEGAWAGYELFYGHLASISVSQGQKIKAGQVLGQMGDTGASSGDHLHLELKQGSGRIDPEPYISPCFNGVYGQGSGTPLKCGK